MDTPFLQRVFDYATTTGIQLKAVNRCSLWTNHGLPDMRGFTPHLRTVNIFSDKTENHSFAALQKKLFGAVDMSQDIFHQAEFWLIHDFLHIIFYDFVSLNLGFESWVQADRFFESHLGSEAFAVLALDYHFLSKTPVKGMAVQIDGADWRAFQRVLPDLPDLESPEFCKTLADLYLGGQGLLSQEPPDMRYRPHDLREKINSWLGHEVRYSEKQRHYVLAWHEDLVDKKISGRKVTLEDSAISNPIYELIRIFHYTSDKEWKIFLTDTKTRLAEFENYFGRLPKYKKKRSSYDFRFTDLTSRPKEEILKELDVAQVPAASPLFLFWQTLSLVSPNLVDAQSRTHVQKLALTSHTLTVDCNAWSHVRSICLKIADGKDWLLEPQGVATFFLP